MMRSEVAREGLRFEVEVTSPVVVIRGSDGPVVRQARPSIEDVHRSCRLSASLLGSYAGLHEGAFASLMSAVYLCVSLPLPVRRGDCWDLGYIRYIYIEIKYGDHTPARTAFPYAVAIDFSPHMHSRSLRHTLSLPYFPLLPLTNPTKFSITPSNASFSLTPSSFRSNQYSSTTLAVRFNPSNVSACTLSSASVNPINASTVVPHSSAAALRSKSGGGGGPLVVWRFLGEGRGTPVLQSSVVELSLSASWSFSRSIAFDARGEPLGARLMLGKTRRFCFEGGKISSRSTGTPRETRKRRRMRLRVQLGGCMGGGETSCCQRERERSERKGEICEGSIGASL